MHAPLFLTPIMERAVPGSDHPSDADFQATESKISSPTVRFLLRRSMRITNPRIYSPNCSSRNDELEALSASHHNLFPSVFSSILPRLKQTFPFPFLPPSLFIRDRSSLSPSEAIPAFYPQLWALPLPYHWRSPTS